MEKLLEDSVSCRVRAKRGCATHPRILLRGYVATAGAAAHYPGFIGADHGMTSVAFDPSFGDDTAQHQTLSY
ncbi:unnamed protein product [Amaranthus hypochondriacus]